MHTKLISNPGNIYITKNQKSIRKLIKKTNIQVFFLHSIVLQSHGCKIYQSCSTPSSGSVAGGYNTGY